MSFLQESHGSKMVAKTCDGDEKFSEHSVGGVKGAVASGDTSDAISHSSTGGGNNSQHTYAVPRYGSRVQRSRI
jgi:3-phosphoglycerate kinase